MCTRLRNLLPLDGDEEIQTQSELEEFYRTPHYAQGAISVQSGWNFGLISGNVETALRFL